MKVKVTKDKKYLKVFLLDTLHIAFPVKNLSVQSWISTKGRYYIEFTGAHVSQWMKYHDRKLWEKILAEVNKVL